MPSGLDKIVPPGVSAFPAAAHAPQVRGKSSSQCPTLAGPVYLGRLDFAREVSLVDLTAGRVAGAVGDWAAAGCRAGAGRRGDEEPPSRASDTSIAPFTSPKGPLPPLLAAGPAWVGLEFVLSCILLTMDGTKVKPAQPSAVNTMAYTPYFSRGLLLLGGRAATCLRGAGPGTVERATWVAPAESLAPWDTGG